MSMSRRGFLRRSLIVAAVREVIGCYLDFSEINFLQDGMVVYNDSSLSGFCTTFRECKIIMPNAGRPADYWAHDFNRPHGVLVRFRA